ncbi:hypothetical protein NM208_g13643 [Fusarium decemcellulare]|uniref:Uncharacterized protein n=1 Tax=Fusarium decemcellulare TaxID=57161 RepID=A0ACC1RJ04_9HYPO|nr:hypothetical protein NM208_g13643 [Fusarium decemcellulare]
MASWENAALRLSTHVHVEPTSTLLHKSLPPVPNQKSPSTTKFQDESSEEDSKSPKGWKPLSLSTPILLAVMALTILLAAAVETIAQRSATQGGLALSPTLDDLPGYAKFGYLYVPTIIAVFYSMIWSWIDLDVKRMQPWFELSKPEGVTAKNSLFLDYPYEFVALVPFQAAKRRHWPTFFGGTAMVVVFWLLTPLQSALLGTEVVAQTEQVDIGTRSQLLPLSKQEPLFNPQLLNTGYGVGWLGQPFPPFTTSRYALLPYYLDDTGTPDRVESNWTAVTTKFSTELNCWPAQIERDGPLSKASFHFLNGQGCNTTVFFGVTTNTSMKYIGYWGSPYSDFALNNPRCPPTQNSTHQFLAVWAKAVPVDWDPSPFFNITAFFCQPQYYKQKVMATVKSTTFEPRVEALGSKEILSPDEFNSTAFEFLLGNGVEENIIVRDFPFNRVIEQHPRLNFSGLSHPVSNMIGFAMAGRNLSVDDYSSRDRFQNSLSEAHQYLFSVAVSSLLANTTDGFNRTASIDYFLTGIIVSRPFSIAVECILVAVALMTWSLLWFCRNAPSNLLTNPSSVKRYIGIFRNSPRLLKSFQSMDHADDKALLEEFQHDECRLLRNHQEHAELVIDRTLARLPEVEDEAETQKGYYEPVKPLVLRRWIGLLFIAVLISAIVVLSYFKQQEKRLNGLHRPSQNFEVLQLLENYIPTVFATLIEPLWVLLTRLLCVLQPFRDLWRGKAEASRSIDSTYTSIPPQLVFWRAVKSRHFILALLCTMALLANLLAVGLGSLFNEAPAVALYPETMHPAYAARFDNSSVYGLGSFIGQNLVSTNQYQDHLYVALANFTTRTTLPPWVSKDYYFQRHNLSNSETGIFGDTYNLRTRGFGVSANCTTIPSFYLPVFKNPPKEFIPGETKDESLCTKQDFLDNAVSQIRQTMVNRSSGVSSNEFCNTLTRSNGPEPCDKTLTLGWGRSVSAENVNGTVRASFMMCYPVFETAMFDIAIDPSGHVLSYNKTSELQGALDYDESQIHTDILSEHYNHQWNKESAQWHNDTIARDWMNYFVVLLNGSRAPVDPEAPVPDPEELRPTIEKIYRRLYPIFLSLNEHVFDHTDPGASITVMRQTKETRIFMENASFIITMIVLGANTLVAAVFYGRSVAFVLPRMPTTLGSILAYVAPSRLASPNLKNIPGQAGRTLSFGRYIGLDGSVHLGIESDPHVVPVNPASLKDGNSLYKRLRRKVFRNQQEPIESGVWI